MKKYTRRNIIQKASLHDKKFVVYDEIEGLLAIFVDAAISAGADKDKLMAIVNVNQEGENNV